MKFSLIKLKNKNLACKNEAEMFNARLYYSYSIVLITNIRKIEFTFCLT